MLNVGKLYAKLRPTYEGCTARGCVSSGLRMCAGQPPYVGQSFVYSKGTKLIR